MPSSPRYLFTVLCFFIPFLGTCVRAQIDQQNEANMADISLTAHYQNRPLREIIPELEARFGLTFSYLEEAVADKVISHRFERSGWPEIEDFLFQRSGIELKIIDGGFVVLSPLQPGTPRNWDVCIRLLDETGQPLPFVTVAPPLANQSLYTDAKGWCRKTLRGTANDSVSFQFLGYQPLRLSLASPTLGDCSDLRLKPLGIDLVSVEVVEYLTDGIEATAEGRRITIRPNAVSAVPGFTENEIYRAVQLLPGVYNGDETAGSLSIRGGARDQTQVLWDGINVYAPGHYLGMISFFSPELVDEVNVWRGQADASYGGRLSGVVRMDTDREVTDQIQAGANVNLTHAGAYLKIPLIAGKSDVHLAGRSSVEAFLNGPTYESYQEQFFIGSSAELAFAPEDEEDIFVDSLFNEREFRFRELNGRWQYNLTPRTSFTLSGFSQTDQFDYELNIAEADGLEIAGLEYRESFSQKNAGAGFLLNHQLPNNSKLEGRLVYSDFSSLGAAFFDNDDDFTLGTERDSRLRDASVQIQMSKALTSGHGYSIGVQYQNLNSNSRSSVAFFTQVPVDDEEVSETTGNNLIAFGTYQFRPDSPFRVDLGLRLQHYNLTGEIYVEPRLTASYRLNNEVSLKAGFGQNHQVFFEVLEITEGQQLNAPASLWVLADGQEIGVSSARELTLGAIVQRKGWLVDLELYRKFSTNLPTYGFGQEPQVPVQDDSFLALGQARNSGMDLLVKKRWKNFRSWVIYSLSSSRFRYEELGDDFIAAADDRPHRFQWVNSVDTKNWLFSVSWQLTSGARYTSTRIVEDPFTGFQFEEFGPFNAEKLPPFSRLDVSAFYHWSPGKGRNGLSGKVGVSALNVLNRTNPTSRSFQTDQLGGPTPSDQLRELNKFGLGFTPNLSVSISWK